MKMYVPIFLYISMY